MIKKTKILLNLYFVILVFVGIGTFLMSEFLITLMFGPNNEDAVLILKILAVAIVIEPLGSFFTPYLVIKNQNKTVSKITFYTMIINFIVVIPLIIMFQAVGMAIAKIFVAAAQVILNIIHNKELFLKT